ncbi:uncharacterized protein LOC114536333 [Dendronephthya gigantea]|uniref:uncharacterized protein LOC114536333 n=1 Tax=Dendronephthya gigantea TaxID=151771 RepID=UPI00106A14E8|nr:uncharacterized protein LOC114536333 [Dendronephthya gigantea]
MAEKIDLVVFDLAGTTVDDTIDGLPLVTVAMIEAFACHGIKINHDQVNKVRGMDKRRAVQCLLKEFEEVELNNCLITSKCANITNKTRLDSLDDIFKDFKLALNSHLININKEIPGTTTTFHWLKKRGIKLAVGSGFPHDVVLALVEKLGWKDLVEYVSSAEQEGHGRPHPSLIHSAMKHCSITNKRSVWKVGDTVMDIEEGRNAGCWTVAVQTGTQTETMLKQSNPDYMINSVADLPQLFEKVMAIHMTKI